MSAWLQSEFIGDELHTPKEGFYPFSEIIVVGAGEKSECIRSIFLEDVPVYHQQKEGSKRVHLWRNPLF